MADKRQRKFKKTSDNNLALGMMLFCCCFFSCSRIFNIMITVVSFPAVYNYDNIYFLFLGGT